MEQFSDRQLQRDCYVAIDSRRKSFNLIQGHLGDWLAQRLSFRPISGQQWHEDRLLLWETLGVEPEVCQLLAYTFESEFSEREDMGVPGCSSQG